MRLSDALRNKALVDLDDALRGRTYSKDEVMRGEPVKFEAGQVVRVVVAGAGGDTYLVQSMYPDGGLCMRPLFESRAQSVGVNPKHWLVELLSPAPRAGDTWTSGESVARVELDDSGVSSYTRLRIVSEGEPFVGDVVAVARRLWEGGYRRVETRVRSAAQSSADVMDSMARAETKKWIERGLLAQDAASRVSVRATSLDAEPRSLGVSSAADARECFAALVSRDAEPPQLSSEEERRRNVPTYLKPKDLDRLKLTFEQTGALLPGIAPIERAPDGGHRIARDPPPQHGDIYKNATQTIRLLVCADGDLRSQIVESSLPEMRRSVARFPQDMMAEYLRERGYVRVEAERPAGEPPARWTGERLRAEAQQLGIDPLPGETDEQLRDRVTAMVRRPWKALYPSDVADRVRECITQCVERGDSVGDAARNIQRAIDSTRADRATGDDLRKLAEVHGVPELRAGMVVRWDRGARPWFGHVEQASASGALIQWSGVGHRSYTAGCVRDYLSESWRIVDPDIRPIAAIADAVAAVFAQPDRATSRKYVDLACAQLRGEPFAQAIRAVLVAACERSEGWPHDAQPAYMILRIVEGAREHERQRSRVARGARSLPDEQLARIAIAVTAARADTAWSPYLARVYERARAAR